MAYNVDGSFPMGRSSNETTPRSVRGNHSRIGQHHSLGVRDPVCLAYCKGELAFVGTVPSNVYRMTPVWSE